MNGTTEKLENLDLTVQNLSVSRAVPDRRSRDVIGDTLYMSLIFAGGLAILITLLWVKARVIDLQMLVTDPFLIGYTFFVSTFEISRLFSAMFYRKSFAGVLDGISTNGRYEPTLSFVIPCMNEQDAITNTVTKCFMAEYPKDKIEVIVINDGSTDNTGIMLNRLKKKYPDRLTVVNWRINRGKRYGMAEGFRLAKGEIIIQLDSDSYIRPDTVRAFIQPFQSPKIGAVCAHADPENAEQNSMTKMQAGYYFMSFRILKAAESTYATVFCCSGCSSAYRKSIVMPVLDEWLGEKFLGLPVTWGDDRGLTNYVLKGGYKTIYTDQGLAYTIVPDTLKKFIKQQIRWKKGWFVNSFFASKFIMRTDPFVALTYFFPLSLITFLAPFMALRALVYLPLFSNNQLTSLAFYLLGVMLIASLVVLFYRAVARENKYWPYVFMWAIINMVILSFLLFYALATIQDRKWGTR